MKHPTNRNYIWDMCTVEDVAIGDAAVGVEVKLDFSMDYLSLLRNSIVLDIEIGLCTFGFKVDEKHVHCGTFLLYGLLKWEPHQYELNRNVISGVLSG